MNKKSEVTPDIHMGFTPASNGAIAIGSNDNTAEQLIPQMDRSFIHRVEVHAEETEKIRRQESDSFIQKKEVTGTSTAPDSVVQQNDSSQGNGNIMDAETKAFMEKGFGANFSNVHIHTDDNAIQMNRDLGAKAFTIGHDIYFNDKQYQPGDNSGKHLLAHELTHVLQQKKNNLSLLQKRSDDHVACDISPDDESLHRIPPGNGAFTQTEYTKWERHHPHCDYYWGSRLSDSQPFTKSPQWFWDRCFFYSGAMYGGFQDAIMEVWLSNKGSGAQYRVLSSTKPVTQGKGARQKADQEAITIEQAKANEAIALDEASFLAQDYQDDKDELLSRAEELKDIKERDGFSEEYIERYDELSSEKEIFWKAGWFAAKRRFPELWESITSDNAADVMKRYNDVVDGFETFDPLRDVEPYPLPDVEPIDFSGDQ
ncbi:MAG: DUF4157 domain-containing protein [Chitinophagaceae bacterium]